MSTKRKGDHSNGEHESTKKSRHPIVDEEKNGDNDDIDGDDNGTATAGDSKDDGKNGLEDGSALTSDRMHARNLYKDNPPVCTCALHCYDICYYMTTITNYRSSTLE
jgi:hypothetical protein